PEDERHDGSAEDHTDSKPHDHVANESAGRGSIESEALLDDEGAPRAERKREKKSAERKPADEDEASRDLAAAKDLRSSRRETVEPWKPAREPEDQERDDGHRLLDHRDARSLAAVEPGFRVHLGGILLAELRWHRLGAGAQPKGIGHELEPTRDGEEKQDEDRPTDGCHNVGPASRQRPRSAKARAPRRATSYHGSHDPPGADLSAATPPRTAIDTPRTISRSD